MADETHERIAVAGLVFCGTIICAVAIGLAIWRNPPELRELAGLESNDVPVTTGIVIDHNFIPSHVETRHFALTDVDETHHWPISLGDQWTVTLGANGGENVWHVTESQYNAARLGETMTINEERQEPILGIAVD